MEVEAGIHWDPREPPPPEYRPHNNAPLPPQQHAIIHPPPPLQQHVNRDPLMPVTRRSLSPLSVALVAKVVHDTANITVTQLFWNRTDSTIGKGTYSFPLPAGCTVIDFNCRVGSNRIVRGQVKSKLEARNAFNDAAQQNSTATLLEQDTTEIFTTTIANIPPNTKLKAEISFITLLKHKYSDSSATTTLTVPTCIASRYNTPPELQHTQDNSQFQELSIKVEVLAVENITTIKSKTHNVDVRLGVTQSDSQSWSDFVAGRATEDPKTALVKLADRITFLDRDFILEITTLPPGGVEMPNAYMEIHSSFINHKAVMLTIPARFMLRNESPIHESEILFVADRSGSMEDKIVALKSAMSFFLRGIPRSRKFNVWCFGTTYTYLWPRSRQYSEASLYEALSYVSHQFRADMGGTELLPALEAIIDSRGGNQLTDVILLTDGEVWRLNETVGFIQQTRITSRGRVRFFALGIGDAVSHELVEGIAKSGGGYAEVIPAASQGGWEDRLVAVLHAALTGHIGPLRISLTGRDDHEYLVDVGGRRDMLRSTRPVILQSPVDISTLSPFLQNRVFMLFDSTASTPQNIIVRTTTPNGDELVTRVPVKTLHRHATTIHQLGARALLGDLERKQGWIHLGSNMLDRNTSTIEQLTLQEGEMLGIKWSLVSKWTSFYAIEESYEAVGNPDDPFLDVDDHQIRHIVSNDLNLLRPRGFSTPAESNSLGAPGQGQLGALDEGMEEEDESTSGSDSDSSVEELLGHDNSDDSGSGDDLDGGEGGGGQANGSGSGQNPRDPDPNHDRGQREGSNLQNQIRVSTTNSGAAPERQRSASTRSGSLSAYGTIPVAPMADFGRHISANANKLPTTTPNHISTTARPYQLPSVFPPNSSSSYPAQNTFQATIPIPITQSPAQEKYQGDKYSTLEHAPQMRSYIGDGSNKLSHHYQPPALSEQVLPVSSTNPAQKTRHSLSSLFTKRRRSKVGVEEDPAMSTYRHKDVMRRSDLSKSREISEVPHDTFAFDYSSPAIPPHEQYRRRYDEIKSKQPACPRAELQGGFTQSMRDEKSLAPGNVFEMSAPIHNPPASTAILKTGSNSLKSPEEKEKEEKIRRLATYQNFDGSFTCTIETLETFFGKKFCQVTEKLEDALCPNILAPVQRHLTATSVAIIVQLEEGFQSCNSLWLMMATKASQYVDTWLDEHGKLQIFQLAGKLLGPAKNDLVSAPTPNAQAQRQETLAPPVTYPRPDKLQLVIKPDVPETPVNEYRQQHKQDIKPIPISTSSSTPLALATRLELPEDSTKLTNENPQQRKLDTTPIPGSSPLPVATSLARARSSRLGKKIQSKFQFLSKKAKA